MGYFNAQRSIGRRADLAAVPVMARAGFDPNALVRYVERVQAAKGRAGEKAEIAKLPPTLYPALDTAALKGARRKCAVFLPLQAPAQTRPRSSASEGRAVKAVK